MKAKGERFTGLGEDGLTPPPWETPILAESSPYLSCPAVSQICNLIFFPPKTIMKGKLDQERNQIDRVLHRNIEY